MGNYSRPLVGRGTTLGERRSVGLSIRCEAEDDEYEFGVVMLGLAVLAAIRWIE